MADTPARVTSRNPKLRLSVASTEVEFEGDPAALKNELPDLIAILTTDYNTRVRTELERALESLQINAEELDASHANDERLAEELFALTRDFVKQVEQFVALVASNATPMQLVAATKQMQETQLSFNLQYLQLQSQMQNENRAYTAVSNIMKTKHDTVKNSIGNIR
jgi:hypothetical protein